MLYEEEAQELDGSRRYLQGGPRSVTWPVTCTSLTSKRLPKHPHQHILFLWGLSSANSHKPKGKASDWQVPRHLTVLRSVSTRYARYSLTLLVYRCKGYFIPCLGASPSSWGLPAPPYKLLGLAALFLSSSVRLCTRLLPILFTISSSYIDSPVALAQLACSLPYTWQLCLTIGLAEWCRACAL